MSQEKRNKVVKVVLSNSEYELAKSYAENSGYRLAVYARESLLKKRIANKENLKITANYLSQFAWIGNNLNQIARHMNTLNAKEELNKIDLAELNFNLGIIQDELIALEDLIRSTLE